MQPSSVLVDRCLSVVDRMAEELRRRMKDLRSPILEGEKLSQALQTLIERVSRDHGLVILQEGTERLDSLSDATSMVVYRIVQEALRNVVRHSEARNCVVTLSRDGVSVHGSVTDDGCGFDLHEAAAKGRLGLLGMKDRCELVGGKFTIETAPGEGTRIVFSLET